MGNPSYDHPPPAYGGEGGDDRPLPPGWVKEWDDGNQRHFYVNTNENPPRSIWVHPLDEGAAYPPQPEKKGSYAAPQGPPQDYMDKGMDKGMSGDASRGYSQYSQTSTTYQQPPPQQQQYYQQQPQYQQQQYPGPGQQQPNINISVNQDDGGGGRYGRRGYAGRRYGGGGPPRSLLRTFAMDMYDQHARPGRNDPNNPANYGPRY